MMTIQFSTLKKRSEFLLLKAKGKRAFRSAFVMQWLIDDADEGGIAGVTSVAVGYTASIKAIGNSVQRNRARRRLRAAVDTVLRLNPQVSAGEVSGQGLKLALIAKDAVLTQPFELLVKDLRTAVAETGLVPDDG